MRQNAVAKFNFEFCSKTRLSIATSHSIAKLRFLTTQKLKLFSLLKIKEPVNLLRFSVTIFTGFFKDYCKECLK